MTVADPANTVQYLPSGMVFDLPHPGMADEKKARECLKESLYENMFDHHGRSL